MAVKIRLRREGRKKKPCYSIVVTDARNPRDGKYIEKLGTYNPLMNSLDTQYLTLDINKFKYWVSNGAQPTKIVSKLTNLLLQK